MAINNLIRAGRHLEPRQITNHLRNARVPFLRIFAKRLSDHPMILLRQYAQVRIHRQVLHDDLLSALAFERNHSRQHLVQDHAYRVDIDLFTVLSLTDLRCHVMKRPDGFGLTGTIVARNELRQTVVTDLNHPRVLIAKHIPRFQVAMNNPVLMQISHPRRGRHEPTFDFLYRHALRIGLDHIPQAGSGHILHHHPTLAKLVRLNIPQRNQVNMLQVQTIPNTSQLNVQVTLDLFKRHFFAGIIQSKVDLSKSTHADPAFDRVAGQRPRAA